jgi:hypothetical protein
MKWLSGISGSFRRFVNDQPGLRFTLLHARLHAGGKGVAFNVITIMLGVGFIVAGAVLRLVPVAGGILLALVGVGMIATQFRLIATWCDGGEVFVREVIRHWRLEHDRRNHGRKF